METFSSEQNFIDGVWRKVRYMEYQREEELRVKQNQKRLRKEKIKLAALLFGFSAVLAVPVFLLNGFSMFSALFTGLLFLADGAAYECLPDLMLYRRSYNEN